MKLIFLNFLALLLISASSLDWQSAGNMSSSNISVINSYINANFTMGQESPYTLPSKVGPFSDYLNGLWAEAWNVVIVFSYAGDNFDAVVYGYAFRDHWVWLNGFVFYTEYSESGDVNFYGTFIIWKDYNCLGWVTINTFSSSTNTFSTDPTSAINTFFNTYPPKYDDIWNIAWKAVTYLQTKAADFKGDHAYTMIISQAKNAYNFGRVCASKYNARVNLGTDPTNGAWGSYILLQMR